MKNAIYNPHDKPVEELPKIYGFNAGAIGSSGQDFIAQLLSENGWGLGSHWCSHEAYMPNDLGIIEGSSPDRHETFKEHYEDGYVMEFVPSSQMENHAGLQAAFVVGKALYEEMKAKEEAEKSAEMVSQK